MKAYGFKQLKRKEGLSFYLKGFMKNKSFKGATDGFSQAYLEESGSLSDSSESSVLDEEPTQNK
jgi:hypothetical protein